METEIKNTIETKEVENATDVVEITPETNNQLAENCESAEESVEDTEESKENEQKTEEKPKVEPLPEQKPFLMSPYERAIHEEMERRATDNPALAEGLKDKDKSISECLAFVMNRAKKMATDNCAMVADDVVYSWAQFYYTQRREIIELEYERPKKPTYTLPAPKPKTESKAEQKKKAEKKAEPKAEPRKEKKAETEKPKDKNIEEIKGGDGKVYKIEALSLF